MNSAFFGLNIGAQALFAARTALDVTSHNIANTNTEGYSRQIVKQRATMPLSLQTGKGMVGTGSEIYDIIRERDYYLDSKYWNENKTVGEYNIKTSQLSLIEGIFNEPSDEGFNTILNDFFNAFQEVANNPESGEVRSGLKEQALTFTQFFNDAAVRLKQYQKDINFELKTKIGDINIIAQKIQNLNREIFRYEQYGSTANDLRDQRDLLVDRLSKIVNVEAKEIEVPNSAGKIEKRFMVFINDQTLVDHFDYHQLETRVRQNKVNPDDAEDLYDIYWDSGLKFDITDPNLSGELKGYLDIRDGNNDSKMGYKGIPHYMNRLNEFVRNFARAINEGKTLSGQDIDGATGHVNGYGLNEETGKYFFAYKDASGNITNMVTAADYSLLTAENFTLSSDLDDINNIAAAKEQGLLGDGRMMLELFSIKNNTSAFSEGTPSSYMQSIIGELAVNAKQASMIGEMQTNISKVVASQRLAISGVDSNEEMTNLVKYNQAYNMAAKMISVMDEIFDVTINRMGVS